MNGQRKKIALLFAALLLSIAGIEQAMAEYDPPPGGEDVYQFYSPLFLGKGFSVTSMESPTADTMNPAASALNQRITLDASYLGLSAFGDRNANRAWQGHGVNLGATFPSRVGVFTSSLHFLSSSVVPMDLGTTFGVKASFAKDLYPNLLVGIGVNLDMGGNGSLDTGLSADLGFLHLPGDVGPMQDFRWGISLLHLGLPYTPVSGKTAMPSPFTPAIGAEFLAIKTDDVRLSLNGTASFPYVQNARLNVGSELSFRDVVSLFGGVQLDLRQLTSGQIEDRTILPSFGLSVRLKTNFPEDDSFISQQGWNQSEVKTRFSAAPLYDGVWGFSAGMNAPLGVIDRKPPEIQVAYENTAYISPNNDGRSDTLSFPLSITDQRYIMGYEFLIRNSDGEVVRTIRNKEDRPENQGFKNILDRLTAVKSGVPIPDELRWDGNGDSGALVPDGTYSFTVRAWDDNGNEATTAPKEVVVDITPPKVTVTDLSADARIFSPNGDGNKDVVSINQSGSIEDLWSATIQDASGKIVRTWNWSSSEPQSIQWDGRNDAGDLMPDGVYQYHISSTDRAQNQGSASLQNIILNTEPTPIKLAINHSYFSPNADGVKDTVLLRPSVPVTQGLVNWAIRVKSADGTAVRTLTSTQLPPQEISYDGSDDEGKVLPEGEYRAELSVVYQNGNNPVELSPPFVVDVSPPTASVRTDFQVFSPNGDGNKDAISFFQETSVEDLWTGEVKNVRGEVVRTYQWRETAELRTTWDGQRDDGKLAADGEYAYELTAVDRAGNRGSSQPVSFTLDTGETGVIVSAEYKSFSPNADNVKDRIQIFPQIKRNEDVDNYTLTITDVSGQVMRTQNGRGPIDNPFVWNGLDAEGKRVPDGPYKASVEVTYRNGNVEHATTRDFTVDTVAPSAEVSADYTLFSPNGDGRKDEVMITQSSSMENLWEGEIQNAKGETVRSYYWKGKLANFGWDGKDESGNQAPDGRYRYVVSATDEAGNSTSTDLPDIRLDTRKTAVFATVDSTGFSPNGDGFKDTVTFSLYTNLTDGATGWRLDLRKEDGTVVKSFDGTNVAAQKQITWDGKTDDGGVIESTYTAQYVVSYQKGDLPQATTTSFILDITPPDVSVNLDPVPFSPDNDGVEDELHIYLDVKDKSDIAGWQFVILDRNNNYFNDFSGKGMPARELTWDGRASDGELVISAEDYPYTLKVTDLLGNTTQVSGKIPVDILVIREGDRLKVAISNITFAPNSPELMLDPTEERGAKNRAILNRLVEVFTKYSSYNIRIEGHAVNISGTQREEEEELKPLSLARAQSVKDALVERGLSPKRITVLGRGGTEPIVPHTDLENRWKNRRVEFILLK